MLTGGSRTALPRQQTLRALIDWSYSLLSEPERLLFKRLAVFVGGWTLAAAEQVCADNGLDPATVLDTLSRLVDKSLVVAEEAAGETRYSRLETIRQYSREKFAETDEVAVVRDRHLAYYVQFSEMAEEHAQRREAILWSRRLEAEQDNLRAALEWGLARNPDSALRMVGALQFYWHTGGYAAEGSRWTQQALERVEATAPPEGASAPERRSAKAKALRGLAWLHVAQADNEHARRWAEQSVALYRQGGSRDTRGLSYALTILAQAQFFLGERDKADAFLKEAIGLSRVDNDVVGEVGAMSILVRVRAVMFGDLESARGYAEEGNRLAREAGLDYFASLMSYNLGLLAAYRLEAEEARLRFGEAIAGFEEYRCALRHPPGEKRPGASGAECGQLPAGAGAVSRDDHGLSRCGSARRGRASTGMLCLYRDRPKPVRPGRTFARRGRSLAGTGRHAHDAGGVGKPSKAGGGRRRTNGF